MPGYLRVLKLNPWKSQDDRLVHGDIDEEGNALIVDCTDLDLEGFYAVSDSVFANRNGKVLCQGFMQKADVMEADRQNPKHHQKGKVTKQAMAKKRAIRIFKSKARSKVKVK